jgi:creatinine amidohydrolase
MRDLDGQALSPFSRRRGRGPRPASAARYRRVIASAMARAGRGGCGAPISGCDPSAAGLHRSRVAAGFPGTLSLRPETVTATVVDIARSLTRPQPCALANAHLIRRTCVHSRPPQWKSVAGSAPGRFPNLASRPWSLRLSDEFRSGACHAGQFETRSSPSDRTRYGNGCAEPDANPHRSRSRSAKGSGPRRCGRPSGYFGAPAAATPEKAGDGRNTGRILGRRSAELGRPMDPA